MPQTNGSFATLFEESIIKSSMKADEAVSAEVVRIDHNFVIVSANLKSGAFVPVEEFLNGQDELEVQVGDYVSVATNTLENGYNDTILSCDKAKRLASRLNLEKALESDEIISNAVTGKIKDGLTVMVNGIRAFLPGSLIDVRPIKDTVPYESKILELKIIKLDRKRNNVVLSRRTVVEAVLGEERQELMETLREDAIVSGIVKNITDYGAFVDLGGIDGLPHITDLAWRCVRHPSEVLSVGQEITTKILKFGQEKDRVSLDVKQLGEGPWVGISRRYLQGTRPFGKVTNLASHGASVEIEASIKGLVHMPEMDWANKNVAPSKIVQLGDEVGVMVLDIDEDKRRIGLGMEQYKTNPWGDFARNHKKGDELAGQIKSVTDFGVFIGLSGGTDGLVHLSDLPWQETGKEAVRKYKEGDKVEAAVPTIDVNKGHISLGIKQLSGDPFNNFVSTNDKGSIVRVMVETVNPKGAVVQLADDVGGYLRASEVSSDRMEDARNVLKEDETITTMIVSIDRKSHNTNISVKAKDSADQQEAMQKFSAGAGAASTTNLGALLKVKLSETNQ